MLSVRRPSSAIIISLSPSLLDIPGSVCSSEKYLFCAYKVFGYRSDSWWTGVKDAVPHFGVM